MKNKILPFIIGILVGAIITTVGFIIYNKNNKNNIPSMPDMQNGGQMMAPGNSENGEPPEKPDGEKDNSQEKQQNSNSSSNNNV